MKKFVALVLAVLLVVSLSVVAHADPCNHPNQVLDSTVRTIVACNASGHTVSVTQWYTCTGCWETFERFVKTEAESHDYMPYRISNEGHRGTVHRWKMGYSCCSYTYIAEEPCSGPPCPVTP